MPVTFTEWRGLRKALGLSQSEMARSLSMSDAGYGQIEREGRKVQQARITILRVLLQEPEVVERLERAGFQHPFRWTWCG